MDLLGTVFSTFKVGQAKFDASGLTAQRVFVLPDASGTLSLGGGATIKTATINVPYDAEFCYITTVSDAALHLNSVVLAGFGASADTAENDAEELADLTLVVNPVEGGLEVTISAPGVFGGPVPINYMIGS